MSELWKLGLGIPDVDAGDHIDEDRLFPAYREARDRWQTGTGAQFVSRGLALVEDIRRRAASRVLDGRMSPDDPLPPDLKAEYDRGLAQLDQEAQNAATGFLQEWEQKRKSAHWQLFNLDDLDPSLLIQATQVPEDQVGFVMSLAERRTQGDLARALAVVSRERGDVSTFRGWASRNEVTQTALDILDGVPTRDQIWDQVVATSIPPAADDDDLRPGQADVDQVRESRELAEASQRMAEAQAQEAGGRRFPVRGRLSTPLDEVGS